MSAKGSEMKSFFNHRVLLVVTGASRGLGLEIVTQFVPKLKDGSVVLLMARNGDKLKANCEKLKEAHPGMTFEFFVSDNAKATYGDYETLLKDKLKAEPEEVVVVHNAGSLGNIQKSLYTQTDAAEIDEFLASNVRHPILLTNAVIALAKVPVYFLNISSLAAVKPMPDIGLYSVAKASRKMFFDCLAQEKPELRVLQYSPGPLDTDMMTEIRECTRESLASMARTVKENGTLLSAQQTVEKLCDIIEKAAVKSGDHVDYFDR